MNKQPTNCPSPPSPENPAFNLVDIMATLRGPQGCPWDREQTTESLKPYLLEEVYEVLEAIDAKDPASLKEELGDLLLQILFHSQIALENGHFSYREVEEALGNKLIRRHPHVFKQEDGSAPANSREVLQQWEQLKQQEKTSQKTTSSILSSIPKTSPALLKALQVQKRASRVGFDWKTIEPVLQKFKEELDELYAATADTAKAHHSPQEIFSSDKLDPAIEEELGDALFSLVNISRFLRINPEEALRKSTNKFISRFQYVESQAIVQGKQVNDFPLKILEQWWKEAKSHERASSGIAPSINTETS